MKLKTKRSILSGLFFGLSFTLCMAFFDWWDGKPFNLLKFFFFFISMGLVQAFMFYKTVKLTDIPKQSSSIILSWVLGVIIAMLIVIVVYNLLCYVTGISFNLNNSFNDF